MSEATLLDMVNTVATELRFPSVTNVIGSKDENTVAIYTALRKAMERDVYRAHPWAALRGLFEVTPDGVTEFWKLPLSFDSVLNETAWDVINKRPAHGALDPFQLQAVTTSQLSVPNFPLYDSITSNDFGAGGGGVRDCIIFWPNPLSDSNGEIRFSVAYMTNWYVLDAATREKKLKFTNDGDTTLIDSELVEQATLVRMLRTLGLGFVAEKAELVEMLRNRSQKDGGAASLDMGGPHGVAPAYPNTPGFVPRVGAGSWGR